MCSILDKWIVSAVSHRTDCCNNVASLARV
jgi:hypothetical protein